MNNRMNAVTLPASIKSLVVDADGQRRVLVEELLSNMGYSTVESCASISELTTKTKYIHSKNVLLILCVDAVTANITNQLQEFLHNHTMPVLMLAENIDKDVMGEAMKSGVTAFLSLGVQGNRVKQAIDSAFANFSLVSSLQRQVRELENRLENRITIDKAKGLIMRTRGLDEPQAYCYMRDYAMKNGKKMIDVAQMTIATAELLDM